MFVGDPYIFATSDRPASCISRYCVIAQFHADEAPLCPPTSVVISLICSYFHSIIELHLVVTEWDKW